MRIAGWFGVLGPVVYVGTWLIAGLARDGYSPTRDAISELGEVGAGTAPAMVGAFVVFGLTAIPFAALVRRALPLSGPALPIAIVVTGVATVGAGVFPCSEGCPGPGASFTDTGHSITATIGYLALLACPAIAGWQLRTASGWSRFALLSLATAVVAGAGMAAWALGLAGEAYGGLLQRAFNTLIDVWWVVLAIRLLRDRG